MCDKILRYRLQNSGTFFMWRVREDQGRRACLLANGFKQVRHGALYGDDRSE